MQIHPNPQTFDITERGLSLDSANISCTHFVLKMVLNTRFSFETCCVTLAMSLGLFGLDLEAVSTFCLQIASQVILSNLDYWKGGGELTSRRQGQCHFHVLFLCLNFFSSTSLYLLYLVFSKNYLKEAQEDEGQASSFFPISPLVKSSQVCLHTALNESLNFK